MARVRVPIQQYSSLAAFPTVGDTNVLYVDTTTNYTYFWNGSAYVKTIT